ncbi:unnamed protein product [Lupinus luteus]|uniref:Uncharacterized protein n=1 Tax=Lupinus luteus TaxID=3873 RepID=A0AAV1YEC8_LUPLU
MVECVGHKEGQKCTVKDPKGDSFCAFNVVIGGVCGQNISNSLDFLGDTNLAEKVGPGSSHINCELFKPGPTTVQENPSTYVQEDVNVDAETMNVLSSKKKIKEKGKRLFWEEAILDHHGHIDELWCVVGDLNFVLNQDERIGSSTRLNSMENGVFAQFVDDMELFDLSLVASKFTWFLSNGLAMSKLDRFLVNNKC